LPLAAPLNFSDGANPEFSMSYLHADAGATLVIRWFWDHFDLIGIAADGCQIVVLLMGLGEGGRTLLVP